jgi:hypothetical protein
MPLTPKQIAKAKEAWDMFGPDGQDMSFEDFARELSDLSDSTKMHEDLMDIQLRQATFNSNRLLVDRSLHNGRERNE